MLLFDFEICNFKYYYLKKGFSFLLSDFLTYNSVSSYISNVNFVPSCQTDSK